MVFLGAVLHGVFAACGTSSSTQYRCQLATCSVRAMILKLSMVMVVGCCHRRRFSARPNPHDARRAQAAAAARFSAPSARNSFAIASLMLRENIGGRQRDRRARAR